MDKMLYLIRHAKSSWETGLPDIERPLNDRGLRDAPMMARLLAGRGMRPDLLISSPAARARATRAFFAEAFSMPAERLWDDKRLYLAEIEDILDVVREVLEEYRTIMLFGHNPGFTYFSNLFRKGARIDNLPTCGIVEIAVKGAWADFDRRSGQVTGDFYPKMFK